MEERKTPASACLSLCCAYKPPGHLIKMQIPIQNALAGVGESAFLARSLEMLMMLVFSGTMDL